MNHRTALAALAAFAREIDTLPLENQSERLREFFNDVAKDISTSDLELLKFDFADQGNDVTRTVAEIIDGELALRKRR